MNQWLGGLIAAANLFLLIFLNFQFFIRQFAFSEGLALLLKRLLLTGIDRLSRWQLKKGNPNRIYGYKRGELEI